MLVSLCLALAIAAAVASRFSNQNSQNDRQTGSNHAQAAAAPHDSILQAKAVPASRGGHDLLGKSLELDGITWLNAPDGGAVELTGKVTLVRWWTDTCPYCAASLPAIKQLDRRYGEPGFQTVAVYHPKPPREVDSSEILRAAKGLGYDGLVASDLDWKVLKREYLSTGDRGATSASFLLDRDGIIRFVHPGPEFRPSEDPEHRQVNQDYQDLKAAIEALLAK